MSALAPATVPCTITIVLADDNAFIRSGLRLILDGEDGFDVVADAGDADSALRSVLCHEPAVLVLDLNMPGELTSLQAFAQIRERSPGTAVVILTMQDDPSFARHALDAGALGYVLKDCANAELVNAVRCAAEGETYLTPHLVAALGTSGHGPREGMDNGVRGAGRCDGHA
jgi:two-component system response regulator NreC